MQPTDILNKIQIASPCPAQWELMDGNGRVRFCAQCSKNVYNLSEMSAEEATSLLQKTEGRLCVRLYRREDGTVLTQNCPVGAKLAWAKLKSVTAAVVVALAGVASVIGLGQLTLRAREKFSTPVTTRMPPPAMGTPVAIMGDVAYPPQTAIMGKIGPAPASTNAPAVVMGEAVATGTTENPPKGTEE